MASKILLAQNPHRSMAIDRVVVIGHGQDGEKLQVLSIDGLQNSEWARTTFSAYFAANAYWNMAALVAFSIGAALAFLWAWWIIILAILIAGRFAYHSKSSGALAGEKILKDAPWVRHRFEEMGLIWEAPAASLAEI